MSEQDNKISVYFDGSCPLCTREIAVYRNRTSETSVEFIDVSVCDYRGEDDLTPEQAMKRFHVRRKDGHLVDGGEAFVALWAETRGFRPLARLFRLPLMTSLANAAYTFFLVFRPQVQRLFQKTR